MNMKQARRLWRRSKIAGESFRAWARDLVTINPALVAHGKLGRIVHVSR